jgi:hypothetical protein
MTRTGRGLRLAAALSAAALALPPYSAGAQSSYAFGGGIAGGRPSSAPRGGRARRGAARIRLAAWGRTVSPSRVARTGRPRRV